MTGNWPQEWDDPDDGFLEETDELAADDARLAEVSAWLAAAPDPVLPPDVEARISAALAAESARSAAPDFFPPLSPPASSPRVLGPASARGRVRRRLRYIPSLATMSGTLLVCLLVAGIGLVLSRGAPSSSSSSAPAAASAAASAPAYAGTSAGVAAPANGSASRSGSSGSSGQVFNAGLPVAVIASGTSYRQATLTEQVRARVAVKAPSPSAPASLPQVTSGGPSSAPASSASPTGAPGARALRACVLQLTKGKALLLVDRATYDGTPAYVIATASHVWVVGLGCTAANPEIVTSVPLAS